MNFGARLETITKWVPKGSSIVDVGTDHAYLPTILAKKEQITFAIAGDIAEGPCKAAQNTVDSYELQKIINIRQGNGLAVVQPLEVDVIVIAGMGGSTMIDILSASWEVAVEAKKIILQPMNSGAMLRKWAVANGWRLSGEDLVEEAGKLYEIIVLERGVSENFSEAALEIGPILLREHHSLLKKQLAKLINHYDRLLKNMENSENAKNSKKYQAFLTLKQEMEALANEDNC